jgi:putative redox protein
MAFEARMGNHRVRLDTIQAGGGSNSGPTPKQLLLASLSACSGMDVVALLRKMHVPFQALRVEASGELTHTHPRVFEEIRMHYYVQVAAHELQKVEKAVRLSQERYCGVGAMLGGSSRIRYVVSLLSEPPPAQPLPDAGPSFTGGTAPEPSADA